MSVNAEDVGANASQVETETTEVVTEEVRQYQLDPEPESKAESPPAGEEKAEEKTRETVHDRINELTKNWRAAERQADELQQENVALRQQTQQAEQGKPPIESDEIPPPKTLADFDYDEAKFLEYSDQRTQKMVEVQTRDAWLQQQRLQTEATRRAEHQTRETTFSSATGDYWETVQNVPVTAIMREAVETSEVGPEVIYYLGKNPQVASGIVQASPMEQARRMALIEIELKGSKETPDKVSKAPPPAKTIKASNPGTRVAASDPDSDKLSDSEWLKRRQKEVKTRR